MADDDRSTRRGRSMAPLVVFGGMGLIGVSTVAVVAIGHCQRDEPYMDSVILDRGAARRGVPTPSPAPGQWGTKRRDAGAAAAEAEPAEGESATEAEPAEGAPEAAPEPN